MKVLFSYLNRQFGTDKSTLNGKWHYTDRIFTALHDFVKTGDFTLGKKLQEFEEKFARFIGVQHAIGVNSGTDALILSLKALGIGHGDEVITSAETFIATAGAIAAVGARPVFVDVNDEFEIDAEKIESAITPKTKAIIPVWFTGNAPQMDTIVETAKKHDLPLIEDSCCAIDASYKGKKAGAWGITGTFSFHPLKNLNVWSDGGIVTTHSDDIAKKVRLLRNHGLVSRDEVELCGINSRLDTLQAVVALQMFDDVSDLTNKRIEIAKQYDDAFCRIPSINIPPRHPDVRHVFHLYMIRVQKRDELLQYCTENGVEAKVHYPIPLPYQKCFTSCGYKKGDFLATEQDNASIISLPCHAYLTDEEVGYVIEVVTKFYA